MKKLRIPPFYAYADSKLDLYKKLQEPKILAGAPKLYPDLVTLNVVPSIVDLLNHDNTDIAIDFVQLLQDLTDEDVLDDNDVPAKNIVLEFLVQILHRLNDSDPDDSASVYATLATIENLIEMKPAVVELVCERTKLMKWLLGKIKSTKKLLKPERWND
ncbi:hypothetical protein Ahy_B08g093219 [Arachis hypogaea]|uniref:Beta-catenin-like protein 1 N-terminal domain-containing protein n=1 Tax=Arachis hypogaea TaxID=3818 RepID=A0A444Y5L2_ARAHY|nr:hypothetical protein Ahy_B08g093219 [Arachis hypogaea]